MSDDKMLNLPASEYRAWDEKNNGTSTFLVICGIVLCLIIVIPTVIHGCSTKQFLTGLGIGLLGAIMPFTFAFVWKDQETTKYTLHGFEFRVTHETFSFLDKQYDLRSFVRFQIVSGRGCKVLVLCQERGAKVRIPILGSIPQLIKAIDSVHKMKAA